MTEITRYEKSVLWPDLPPELLPAPGHQVRYDQSAEALTVLARKRRESPASATKDNGQPYKAKPAFDVFYTLQKPDGAVISERCEVLQWFPSVGSVCDWISLLYDQQVSRQLRALENQAKDNPKEYEAIKRQIKAAKAADRKHPSHDLQSWIYDLLTVTAIQGTNALVTTERLSAPRPVPISCIRVVQRAGS